MKVYALKIVTHRGEEQFICEGGSDVPVRFEGSSAAQRQQVHLLADVPDPHIRAVKIVRYPAKKPSGSVAEGVTGLA